MSRQILQDIIDDFQVENFTRFFRAKNDNFQHPNESLHHEDAHFGDGKKLEEIAFDDGNLIVCSFRAKQALSERSGKKAQYELGKKILRDTQIDAGIFIFYDKTSSFRFSLIYANYLGRRRDWSAFRRFTYFVSPDLTNKTFLQRIGDGDFSSLAKIKEAFSVEKVTEEFYKDIANWYFWAVEHCRFPKDAEAEENGRNVAVIRLITRMIFIWFMRERGLVPKELFEEKNVQAVLKDTDSKSPTYYRAILQNLFFATLSTKKEERQFRDEKRFNKGWNKDFGNQYVFRYHDLFASPEKIKDYFGDIPFLNGGLFECLDDGRNDIYIDGFTERKKEYQPQAPNFLFFSGEKKADLNSYYGTKGRNYKVRGLFNILSSFNFTIDENSPDDADIALDPELLGRVFENLLASFNPETSTTARKATGSYYTPREIVDYMVTESLKEYFKTHLPEAKNTDEKLETLFSTGSDENPFGKAESKKLVNLIEGVRIVDPAVGSGAFPMGALNSMVFILGKIDSGNELWKQAQLEAAETIPDPQVRRNTKKQIEEFFKDKNADYGRKLYLIQKCIYGVDIQQIAVEIAKLRFFISLLVDEKIEKSKDNWGIEPLPNLDFKIMQGNSLISEFLGIDFDNGQAKQEQAGMLFTEKEDTLIKEFEQKKIDFQNEPDKNKKAKLKNEVEDLMIKIFETKVRKQKADHFRQMEEIEKKYATLPNKKTREEIITKEKQKLSQKTGFDLENIEKQLREFTSKNKTKPFFAWKLYFAEVFEKGGFDIAITNPPYVNVFELEKDRSFDKQLYRNKYISASGAFDLFVLFHERCIQLVNPGGISTLISPNKFLSAEYAEKLRHYIVEKSTFINLLDLSSVRIFEASVYPVVSLYKKAAQNRPIRIFRGYGEMGNIKIQDIGEFSQRELKDSPKLIWSFLIFGSPSIYQKMNSYRRIVDICNVTASFSVDESYRAKRLIRENTKVGNGSRYKKLLISSNVHRYYATWGRRQITYLKTKYQKPVVELNAQVLSENRLKQIKGEKIIIAGMTQEIRAFLDVDGQYVAGIPTIILTNFKADSKYILSLVNSRLYDFYFHQLFGSLSLAGGYLRIGVPQISILPFKQISEREQKPFIDLVEKILAITSRADYDPKGDTALNKKVNDYEKQIDQLVYNLYGLTDDEIKIIEGQSIK